MTSPPDMRLRGRYIDLNDRMRAALGIANGELREAALEIHAPDLPDGASPKFRDGEAGRSDTTSTDLSKSWFRFAILSCADWSRKNKATDKPATAELLASSEL